MHYIPFNSRQQYHKSVFGALPSGGTAVFRVILPRDLRCNGVQLLLRRDGENRFESFPFSWEGMEGNSQEWWRAEITVGEAGLYWYYFQYSVPFGSGKITDVGSGVGALSAEGGDWQLTVYDKGYETPAWLRGSVIYQIFPDRFCNSGKEKKNVPYDRIMRDDWGGVPFWKPNESGITLNNDYFCGDLEGIASKLDYLVSLGVGCIYLNPIFEAHSNHRYDTADYMKIDPLLGDEKSFSRLCREAHKRGIKVVLDGVFSHTGADSIYFNKNGRYDSIGAYNSQTSKYIDWYKFRRWRDDYVCWWGVLILPETVEENPDFIEFITGENGVLRKWLRLGADGWRLDVADELPDIFLDAVRKAVKAEKPEAVLIGEVWEDASNKTSYSHRRRYLLGEQLDSVMNYPFANAIMYFLRTGVATGFTDSVVTILENYPPQTSAVLMNHIGTHDTARAITAIAGESCERRDRQWQSTQRLSAQQRENGIKLMKLASAIQFTLPGVPSIYYGDEAGVEGGKDPFNRGCFPWGNEEKELVEWYRLLGSIRRENPAYIDGDFMPLSEAAGCVAYARCTKANRLLTIANRNPHPITYYLPLEWHNSQVLTGGSCTGSVEVDAFSAVILKCNF